ncbi:MAG TPA: hypothetical protein VK633_12920 [Verrucomicrobiae bacterium]|nr:hypothetical protein [Verrucomicrobiae bacterium]
MKNINYSAIVLSAVTASLQAQSVLSFDSLPSSQGWSYSGDIVESSAFSLAAPVLTLNTLTPAGANFAIYSRGNPFNPASPVDIEFTGRVLNSDSAGAFAISYWTGSEVFQLALSGNQITAQGNVVSLDASVFHDFRFAARPGQGSELFIDNVSASASGVMLSSVSSQMLFGDGNPGPNADTTVEVNRLSFTAVPEPTTYGCITGVALAGFASIRCCARNRNRKFPI